MYIKYDDLLEELDEAHDKLDKLKHRYQMREKDQERNNSRRIFTLRENQKCYKDVRKSCHSFNPDPHSCDMLMVKENLEKSQGVKKEVIF